MSGRVAFLVALAAASCTGPARAETFHALVRYECQPESDRIVISHRGAFEEAGAAMVKNKGPDEWNPWQLVTIREQDERAVISEVREATRTCRLSDGEYTVMIRPRPGNRNLLGRCGLHMTSGVRVTCGGRAIVDTDFEGDCSTIGPVVAEIVVAAGEDARIRRVAWEEFYKQSP